MDYFNYRDGRLYAEEVKVADIANAVGTPCYIYSRATIERHWRAYDSAFGFSDHSICYAVKANSNLAVLNLLTRLGSGFDIVSGGELEKVLQAGGDPLKIVFSGVGKSESEIRRALEVGIRSLNIESEMELQRISAVAVSMDRVANISVRVNPDVDPKTHPYIATGLQETKFGIPIEDAPSIYQKAKALPNIRLIGIACHIGSQLTDVSPFVDALDRVLRLHKTLVNMGINVKHLDMGGGLGIRYRDETPPLPADLAKVIVDTLKSHGYNLSIAIQPGRSIVGNAGILATRIEYLKKGVPKNFAIVDAAMNDLLRPALYQAWQEIIAVNSDSSVAKQRYDVVGPVCETADTLGFDRPLAIQQGDLLAVRSSGAYGAVMASNYNARQRPPEVLVDGNRFHVVRQRESFAQMSRDESILPAD